MKKKVILTIEEDEESEAMVTLEVFPKDLSVNEMSLSYYLGMYAAIPRKTRAIERSEYGMDNR